MNSLYYAVLVGIINTVNMASEINFMLLTLTVYYLPLQIYKTHSRIMSSVFRLL